MQKTVIYVTVTILLLLSCVSCNSQNSKSFDIRGNWYNYNDSKSSDIFYIETFFGDDYFQSFNENGGLMPSKKYIIKKDKIYLVPRNGGDLNIYATFKLHDSTLEITANNETIKLKRIISKKGTLEEYINRLISEKEFWQSFNLRKINWENSRSPN